MDNWSTDDGLPGNSIICLAQTLDGYLWLGTFAGLVRFDGVRFKVFDAANTPQLPSSKIVTLLADQRGRLWIRAEAGHLSLYENGRFTRLDKPVAVLAEDKEGQIWVPSRGIFSWENDQFVTRVPFSPKIKRGYLSLLAGHDGTIWGTGGKILTKLWPGEVVDYFFTADRPEALVKTTELDPSRAMQPGYLQSSRDGGIWMADKDGLRKLRDGRWQEFRRSPGPLPPVASLYEDRSGNVWAGLWEGGLLVFNRDGEVHRLKLTDGPAHEPVRSFLEDNEGNMWIGTGGAGLFRLKPAIFTTYGLGEGLKGKIVRSISAGKDGSVWMLNMEQLHRLPEGTSRKIEPVPSDIRGGWCNLLDRDGTLWIGTRDKELLRFRDGKFSVHPTRGIIQAIFQDRAGQVWIGGVDCLRQVEGEGLRDIVSPESIKWMDITALADDTRGNLYVGSNGKGLFRYGDGQWSRVDISSGIPEGGVLSLHVDAEDTVWIGGYDRGLSRLKHGRLFTYSAPSLRLPKLVGSILEDDQANLWLTSSQGLFRASKKELSDFAEGKVDSIDSTQFTKRDGLATSQFSSGVQPVACKGNDGRLWFATVAGVAMVDPARLPRNSLAPPTTIEEVLVDDVPIPQIAGEVTIPPGRHRLEIRFAALSLTAPEKSRFKYRLQEFDRDWVSAGTRRFAQYTAVGPGRYRFQVMGSNNDGVWSESGASLAITISPHYWQTFWFRATALALLSGLLFLAYHRRIAALKRERRLQTDFSRRLIESQEQERKRISGELHDGLGQSLLLIRTRAMLGRNPSPAPNDDAAQFQAISEAAMQAINEVRAIAYDLRPYELDRLGLTKAIESVAGRASEAAGVKTELALELIDDLLPPECEIHLYRIAQEALSNTVKYARAKLISMTLNADDRGLHLVIRDDGCGFTSTNMTGPTLKGGLGLVGISERAKLMGGHATLTSAPGQGTTLTVLIPLLHRERN